MGSKKDGGNLLEEASEDVRDAAARLDRDDGDAERLFPESFRASGTAAPVS